MASPDSSESYPQHFQAPKKLKLTLKSRIMPQLNETEVQKVEVTPKMEI